MSEWARAAVAPDFEMFQKLEIMRMISFFLTESQVERRWNSRIEDCGPCTWLPRVCTLKLRIATPCAQLRHTDSPELRIMRPCAWFRHTYVGQVLMSADSLAWLRDRR